MTTTLLVEFDSPAALAGAARLLRERGHATLDAYAPYSTEEVREALGHPPSRLPYAVFVAGMVGAGGAYALEWYTTGHLYPLNVGGRPPHMPLAYVPISFEMGVLAAAFTAFVAVLVLGDLVRWHDPVFEVPGFESASVDRFWLRVDEAGLDPAAIRAALEPLGPRRHVLLEAS
jgi:ActD protein